MLSVFGFGGDLREIDTDKIAVALGTGIFKRLCIGHIEHCASHFGAFNRHKGRGVIAAHINVGVEEEDKLCVDRGFNVDKVEIVKLILLVGMVAGGGVGVSLVVVNEFFFAVVSLNEVYVVVEIGFVFSVSPRAEDHHRLLVRFVSCFKHFVVEIIKRFKRSFLFVGHCF